MDLSPVSCEYNYVATAHKPTSVEHSAVGNFTSAHDQNLIISKSTRLEIHKLTADGLQGLLDVPIFGRITALKLIRIQGDKDLLFILTQRYKFCILEYDESTGELLTRANGDVSEKVGRPADSGQLVTIDPLCRAIGLHLYDGHFKVIPIKKDGNLQEAFTIRLPELKVVDIAFLYESTTPTFAVLYEDTKENRHVKTYQLLMKEKELVQGPWSQDYLDLGSSVIIPIRGTNGAVVIGSQAAVFVSKEGICSTTIGPTFIKAYGEIDDSGGRFLLGDHVGNLYLLVLNKMDNATVTSLSVELLGKTSQPSTLSYLDTGIIFVGSTMGDSMLVKLHANPFDKSQPDNFVELIDQIPNIGPVVDFCVVDLDRQGQGQIITCSGIGFDGSLRVIRNGIGFAEQASIDLPGVKGIWSMKKQLDDEFDSYLVLTFVGETRVLGMNSQDELDEIDFNGFDTNAVTLWCGNVMHEQHVQVTNQEVRLMSQAGIVALWKPASREKMVMASGNASQIAIVTSDGEIIILNVDHGTIAEIGRINAGCEISCLDLTPLSETGMKSEILVVGTWSLKIILFSISTFEKLSEFNIGGEVMPRSVLLGRFDGTPYVLCGLGDGMLITFRIDGQILVDKKKLAIGTKPINLRSFVTGAIRHVFAACDRPTVIYNQNGKLMFSNLNESEVDYIAGFSTKNFPESLAIVKSGSLVIGMMDQIQRLHVRTVPLNEQPRRIAHQASSKSLLVGITSALLGLANHVDSVRLIDDQTFETLDVFKLGAEEMVCSVFSGNLANETMEYYFVGTAFTPPREPEPSKGRILVFEVSKGKLHLMAEKETKGAVYAIKVINGNLLAGINSRVQVYNWETKNDVKELIPTCSHAGHIVACFLDTIGEDHILVGDVMRSVELLLYRTDEGNTGKLESRGRDYDPAQLTACKIMDENIYMATDTSMNMFTVKKSDAATDEERIRLEHCGSFHLGQFINTIRKGSLVMKQEDRTKSIPTFLAAGVEGSVLFIASLPETEFIQLEKVQRVLRGIIKGVGGFDHAQWRSSFSPFKTADAFGFVDGDCLEAILDASDSVKDNLREVLLQEDPEFDFEGIIELIEELSRLH